MTPDHDPTRTADPGATRPPADPPTATCDPAAALRHLLDAGATVAPNLGTSSAIDPPPGFVIQKELGVGGMGVVYLARQVGLNRPVALKLVKGGTAVDAKALIRFLAEAEVVASIKHPNVVEVYQYGDYAGKPYMALEFCPGGDLTTLTSSTPTRDAAWFRHVADLMAKVADGVNAAHARGIVHRDLKPHNVFLTADGTPKVADFGLAKRGLGSDLTNTGAVMGTPAYMAPEQAGGGTKFVGPEADVWALGVMLFELCCGQRPIDTSGPMLDVLARVVRAEVPPLWEKCPTVPMDLARVVHKCLSADPRDRYPTAGGLATDLRNWLDGKPISARPASTFEQAVKWAKRNKRLAGMGLAVFVTMAVATGVSLGFGWEANKQAEIAKGEKARAEKETEQTERTLAKALLAPMLGVNYYPGLGAYEAGGLWELTALRRGRIPLMLTEAATADESAAAQYRRRAEYLDHSAVGLDATRRREVDELLAARLRDPTLSAALRRDIACAAVEAERFGSADTLAAALTAGLGTSASDKEGGEVARRLVQVAGRLPARQAVEVLVTGLEKSTSTDERLELAAGLPAAVTRLAPGEGVDACRRSSAVLTESLRRDHEGNGWEVLATGLVAAARRLPAGEGVTVLGAAAHVLVEKLAACKDTYSGRPLVRGLLGVTAHLPAAQSVGMLLNLLKEVVMSQLRLDVAVGLAAVADRLPADEADRACRPAVEIVERIRTDLDWAEWAKGLAAVCERIGPEEAAAVCRRAVEAILDALEDPTPGNEKSLAVGLAAVCGRLPPGEAAINCNRAATLLLALLEKAGTGYAQLDLAEGVAAVCGRIHSGTASKRCLRAAQLLADDLENGDPYRAAFLVNGLNTVSAGLPPQQAVGVRRPAAVAAARNLSAALNRGPTDSYLLEMAKGVVAVSGWLTPEEANEVCGTTAEKLVARLEEMMAAGRWPADRTRLNERILQSQIASRLADVCGGLPVETSAAVCRRAAALFVSALRSEGDDFASERLTEGLIAVTPYLPADELFAGLQNALDASARWGRRNELTTAVAAVTSGLPAAKLFHVKHGSELAALTGAPVLHPVALPKPRPLPPQQLVELLKHPFCVKEGRRAVLDALEFTYDRKFADLWEFVAFAEKEHPELDLLSPPKRPERK